jgi:hypothetical protein
MRTVGGPAALDAGAREVAPWIVRTARLGFAAKGLVYLVIGLLALFAAVGKGGRTTDAHGALRVIGDAAAGRFALGLVGVGLLGYALWRLLAAASDAERRGSNAKGIALRLGQAGRGLVYGSLGVEALRLLAASTRANGNRAEHWTARVLDAPFGRWAVAAAGAAVVAYGLYQLYRAALKDPRKHLDLADAGAGAAAWVDRLGRFGIAARGVVFVIIGWFLVRAAMQRAPERAGGIDDSLALLAAQPYGRLLLGVVAAGLGAYGAYQLANARYRRMRLG